MRSVRVTPAEAGWAVQCDDVDNEMMFRSGAKAEAAARRLAQALADAGEPVEIQIHLRDGGRAARFVCFSPALAGEPGRSESHRWEEV
jgi:hypothetical protein